MRDDEVKQRIKNLEIRVNEERRKAGKEGEAKFFKDTTYAMIDRMREKGELDTPLPECVNQYGICE